MDVSTASRQHEINEIHLFNWGKVEFTHAQFTTMLGWPGENDAPDQLKVQYTSERKHSHLKTKVGNVRDLTSSL